MHALAECIHVTCLRASPQALLVAAALRAQHNLHTVSNLRWYSSHVSGISAAAQISAAVWTAHLHPPSRSSRPPCSPYLSAQTPLLQIAQETTRGSPLPPMQLLEMLRVRRTRMKSEHPLHAASHWTPGKDGLCARLSLLPWSCARLGAPGSFCTHCHPFHHSIPQTESPQGVNILQDAGPSSFL